MSERTYKISFTVEPKNSSLLIAEAFGIMPGWVNHIVDVSLPYPLPLITLITGESGCGKSTLLREIAKPTIFQSSGAPLHSWADSDEDALRLLNSVGLNDASLFVLSYSQLSDSQQARARMYYWLCQKEKTLVVDEFLSTLDRKTAQALAFSFQRVLRREGIHLIAATAHDDLASFLRPDLVIQGTAFPSDWVVMPKIPVATNPFDALVDVRQETEEGKPTIGGTCRKCGLGVDCTCAVPDKNSSAGKAAYQKSRLGEIHYKGKYTGGLQEYFSASLDGRKIGWLVGVRNRNKVFQISRVVVHPTYRGCGIGQRLIRVYIQKHPDAVTVAAMARFNPVFERAGMHRVADVIIPTHPRLKKLPLTPMQWASYQECYTALEKNPENLQIILDACPPLGGEVMPGGKEPTGGVKQYLKTHIEVAAKVAWRNRPRVLAKYVGPAHPQF